jgi:uncharacterized damage-inducible protein DinB
MSNTSSVTERVWPETNASEELRLQWEFLRFLRITAVRKVSGLNAELASATPFPSSPYMSALGVIKHLTAVERWWISIIGGGLDVPMLWEKEDVNAEWRLDAADTPEAVLAAYREEWPRSEDALAGMGPDDATRRGYGDQRYTVRWVLTHLIQETARHVGHLDVLREFADGEVGE